MLKNSSVFSPIDEIPSMSNTLTKLELDDFREMLVKVEDVIICEPWLYEFEDEQELLENLVFMWQQQSQDFRTGLPLPIKEWFLSKFVKPSKGQVFFKGMHFKRDANIDIMSINSSGSFITSTTTDRKIADSFAVGHKDYWKERNHICCVYKVTGDLVFDVKPYRDFDEEEFIVYNPKFELIEILN